MEDTWANVVPAIEAVAPGIESVVIPHGSLGFLSFEGLPVRAYVFGDAREVVLIDSGYDSRLSFEAICSAIAGRRVAAILLTHRHPDHGGGAAALAARFGAPVRVRPQEAESIGAAAGLAFEPMKPGDSVVLQGGRALVAVEATGHTRGSLAFHDPAEGFLFSGDAVLGEGTVVVGPPDGNMTDYLATLERFAALKPVRAILPGHGPRIDDPRERIELYLRHRKMREAQIVAELGVGPRTPDDIVASIYEGQVPAHLLPLARISAVGHLEKLVRDGRASCEGETFRLVG